MSVRARTCASEGERVREREREREREKERERVCICLFVCQPLANQLKQQFSIISLILPHIIIMAPWSK